MKREECIKVLQALWRYKDCGYSENEIRESLDMAIKALEQESCNDVISRQDVLNTLDSTDKFLDETRTVESYKTLLEECYKNLPPVTPARPKGHWIYGYTFPDGQYRKCSVCKELVKVVAGDGNFCGHCGAKMESEE